MVQMNQSPLQSCWDHYYHYTIFYLSSCFLILRCGRDIVVSTLQYDIYGGVKNGLIEWTPTISGETRDFLNWKGIL